VRVRALSPADARDIAAWRYPGRDATYDVVDPPTPEEGYWAVEHAGRLVGYCCVGAEARVPGVDEQDGTVDVGYGMRPELVGHGQGPAFVGAILAFVTDTYRPRRLRLLILDWNERSRRVAEGLGFARTSSVTNDNGTFLVMVRPVAGVPAGPPRE
jgi:RimJ/RimL family protein N-acetyltransferase